MLLYFILSYPYMFRPMLGHHQRNKLYPHVVEMLYKTSERLHTLVVNRPKHVRIR
jgi:hypothetical protein